MKTAWHPESGVPSLVTCFRQFFVRIVAAVRVYSCRIMYPFVLWRLRAKVARGEKLKVVFVVTDVAKWKCQSVYEGMENSSYFTPSVAVIPNVWNRNELTIQDQQACLEICRYFRRKNMQVEMLFDFAERKILNLKSCSPDIVFFQQPWFSVRHNMPFDVAKFALTCYVPYFTPNYCNLDFDCCRYAHKFYHLHFVLNEKWVEMFERRIKKMSYVGKFVAVGHPMIDNIRFDSTGGQGKKLVIYAPHWTVNSSKSITTLQYSTFDWNGREILDYALSHPQFRWVFKPHPSLRKTLIKTGVMTEKEVDDYYQTWNMVGTVMSSGNYEALFDESFVMITDSGSFLTEYAVTGKPIIHLLSSSTAKEVADTPLGALYSTYYQVRNLREMNDVFSMVLEGRKDPRREKRLDQLMKVRIDCANSSSRIMKYLVDFISQR